MSKELNSVLNRHSFSNYLPNLRAFNLDAETQNLCAFNLDAEIRGGLGVKAVEKEA
jgi:hypothetical protein